LKQVSLEKRRAWKGERGGLDGINWACTERKAISKLNETAGAFNYFPGFFLVSSALRSSGRIYYFGGTAAIRG
jgi:hypothetical protein